MSNTKIRKINELTCKPLDTYEEVFLFLENPPPWRTLCKGITPHSQSLIRNIEINKICTPSLEMPETFCHFDPDAEEIKRYSENKLPKTLVCHDMANGYHDDSIIDGTGNYGAYTFYNWAGVDIFCYFSHHLITIPPLGWINVAHAHGVKVIGTIITEWNDGAAFWERILTSELEYQTFASALVAIAKTLKFDGWLLNIENNISRPKVLLEFVRYFHQTLHQEVPGAELIWYDSVTVSGQLNWQNGLNDKNRAFFDACDGLFTNYSWSEQQVASSAAAAGDRLPNVYIGVDVWGRNFYGGGQFNTQTAVAIARKYGCSLAIFAPAWTHEAMSQDKCDVNAVCMAEELDKYGQFLLRDRALWGSIWLFLNTRVPCALPFQTSFCRGQGLKRRLYGEVLCPVPWYNLRHMQYQPNSAHGPHGYYLSTLDVILYMSQHANNLDDPSVLQFKEYFQQSRLELHSVRNDNDITERDDSLNAVDVNAGDIEPKYSTKKTNISFKNLFKFENSEMQNAECEELAQSSTTSGQALTQVKIGQAEKTRYALAYVPEECECLEMYYDDSFIGGSCLKINPSDGMSLEHRVTRLFHCDFLCKESLVACVVTKTLPGHRHQGLNVKLFMKNAEDEDLEVVLVGQSSQTYGGQRDGHDDVNVYTLEEASGEDLRDLQNYLLLNSPASYVPMENAYDWSVRYYLIETPGARVTSVILRTDFNQGPVLLGYFGLCERSIKTE